MDVGIAIEWMIGTPIIVLIIAIALWRLLGRNDCRPCQQCSAPKIFGNKCIVCGNVSKLSKQ